MNRFRTLTATLVVVALAAVAPAWAQDQEAAPAGLSGDWEISMEGPQGMVNMMLTIVQEEAVISGTLDGPMGPLELEGEIAEGEVSFWASVDTPQGTMDLVFSGTVEENKKITGWMDVGGGQFGTEFTAERVEKQ